MASTKKPYEPKLNHKVNVTTRSGHSHTGKIVSEHPGTTGTYYGVNVGDAKNPDVRKFRASELTKV